VAAQTNNRAGDKANANRRFFRKPFYLLAFGSLLESGQQLPSRPRVAEASQYPPAFTYCRGKEERDMSKNLNDDLPEALRSIRTRSLFVMRLNVPKVLDVGATPGAYRRIGLVAGGSFEGDRLSGEVLDGGSDWLTARNDGSTTLNVRLVLKTTDGALICMTYQGLRHGPSDVMNRIAKGEAVDPSSYYFRINPLFETSVPRYDWINRIVAVGSGHRLAVGPIYSVFEIL
jgi:Protein of unknown function (DUF3237)